MDFWTAVEDVRARWNVLEHPFYERWSDGALRREELARYAGQYRHAVVALADASQQAATGATGAARELLEAHAAEERAHVALWDGFVDAVGGDADAPASPQTAVCAHTWARPDRSFEATLAALYAIESGQPAIAHTKRQGLREHYGVNDGRGVAYFEVHATRDHEHAAQERALLDARLQQTDAGALLAEVEAVLRANWTLLDGANRG